MLWRVGGDQAFTAIASAAPDKCGVSSTPYATSVLKRQLTSIAACCHSCLCICSSWGLRVRCCSSHWWVVVAKGQRRCRQLLRAHSPDWHTISTGVLVLLAGHALRADTSRVSTLVIEAKVLKLIGVRAKKYQRVLQPDDPPYCQSTIVPPTCVGCQLTARSSSCAKAGAEDNASATSEVSCMLCKWRMCISDGRVMEEEISQEVETRGICYSHP